MTLTDGQRAALKDAGFTAEQVAALDATLPPEEPDPDEAAMLQRRGETSDLAFDPAVVATTRAALAVNSRPVQVLHAGHPAGLTARVEVDDNDGQADPGVFATIEPARKRPAGAVTEAPSIGGAVTATCARCGASVPVSAPRLLRDAIAALVARARGETGLKSRVILR